MNFPFKKRTNERTSSFFFERLSWVIAIVRNFPLFSLRKKQKKKEEEKEVQPSRRTIEEYRLIKLPLEPALS